MAKYLKPATWKKYIDLMNDWHDDTFQQTVEWRKSLTLSKNGEDNNWGRHDSVILKGLIHYNYFRSWPMSQSTDTGEIDKENCMIYFNLKYMRDQGLLTPVGDQFMFDPGVDRFIINGVMYKAMGDSQVGQAFDMPLWIFIICKREETETGQKIYDNG